MTGGGVQTPGFMGHGKHFHRFQEVHEGRGRN